ncbi:MAG TPA: oligosaccharide flippase family protein [Candidatus Nanoarchaeia archaeon]|nr:oligosaccharide flippase family protein [Candidatus Nanoarchaeia archaeon]
MTSYKLYHTHRETIHNFLWRSLQIFGKQGIIFLIFILCAKLLTPYDFGIYNYVLAIIFFLIIFGDFGISTATSKYVAEYNVTDREKLKSVLFNSGIIILSLTILITIITLIFGKLYLQDKYTYILYILPLIFLAPITSLYDGVYRGLKKFKQLSIITLIVGILSLSFVYIFIKQYGLIGALISQNLFYVLLLIGLALGYRDFSFKLNKEVMKTVATYSLLAGLADLGIFLYIRADIVILGLFNYINEIAYYELANRIFMLLALPFAIFSQVIAPNITRLFVNKEYNKIKFVIKRYFIYSIIIAAIISLLSYLIVKPLIIYFLPHYDNNYFYLFFNLLLIIFPIRVFGTILATSFIVSTGNAKIITYNNLLFGILNVVMDVIFIYLFGFVGVIYSTIILGYISVLIAYYYFNKNINLKNEKSKNINNNS